MSILDHWNLEISVDEVLHAQGANPADLFSRKPNLFSITRDAISLGNHLIKPAVLYKLYTVKSFRHNKLELLSPDNRPNNCYLSGELIAKHLANAKQVFTILCTIGNELDEMVSSLFNVNPLSALALDGYGSAAVEQLAMHASNYFEQRANEQGMSTSIPLNPGMSGWPVEDGQVQIFSLLESQEINVNLTETLMMVPSKSLSMVIGMGENLSNDAPSCEYCSLKGVCKYQNHYAKN